MKRYHVIKVGGVSMILDVRHKRIVDDGGYAMQEYLDKMNKDYGELPDGYENNNAESEAIEEFLGNTLLDFVNGRSHSDYSILTDRILHGHRTLQQQVFGLICKLIRAWGKEKAFDARNELTVKRCKAIVDAGLADGVPLI
jgi:hypothetical protein